MTLRWPCDILRPRDVSFDIASRTLAAPTASNGLGQVVSSDAGVWKAMYGQVIVKSRTEVLVHRALAAQLEGRLNPILVPLCRAYQPLPDGLDTSVFDGVPHDDDTPFDDDSLYMSSVNSIQLTSNLPARAVVANVVINYGGTLYAGQHFSFGERLYRIRSVTYTTPTTATIEFRPPLRDPVSDGDYMNVDDPVCRMKLRDDDGMDLELSLRRFGSPTTEFIEDV